MLVSLHYRRSSDLDCVYFALAVAFEFWRASESSAAATGATVQAAAFEFWRVDSNFVNNYCPP